MRYTTVFLDRDGVINRDSPDYIKSRTQFHPLPGSIQAIVRLSRQGVRVIVITNQSAVNRGMIPLAELQAIHNELRAEVSDQGGRIDDILFCPHRPDEHCGCRKPLPGMILEACKRHGIDAKNSVMIGDSAKDIMAGRAAGCAAAVLVRTGNADSAIRTLSENGHRPDRILADLAAAADWILDRNHG